MKINLAVFYSQWDGRWAKELLGFNTNIVYNLYNYGCFISCLAMVAKYYGKRATPQSINQKLKAIKGYDPDGGLYRWGSIIKIFSDISEKRVKADIAPLTDGQMNEIKSAIDKGYPVMAEIDYNPRTVKDDMHFVLIVGYNPDDENDFTIIDPLGGVEKSLKKYLGWFRPSARKSIEQYLIYKGKIPSGAGTTEVITNELNKLRHNSKEWSEACEAYELGIPESTKFDVLQQKVGGYVSQATTQRKLAAKLKAKLEIADEKIGNLTERLTKATNALKGSSSNLIENIKKAVVKVESDNTQAEIVQVQLDSCLAVKEKQLIKINQLEAGANKVDYTPVIKSVIEWILDKIKRSRLWEKIIRNA